MPQLSVQVSDALYKNLGRKAKDMGDFSISDAVRVLLQNALEQPDAKEDRKLHKQLLHYIISTYYMVQAHLLNEFEEGEELNDEAHGKANEVLEELLNKKTRIS